MIKEGKALGMILGKADLQFFIKTTLEHEVQRSIVIFFAAALKNAWVD